MLEIMGYMGSFLLSICGGFEAFRSIKIKRCDLGWAFLLSWLSGDILLFFYVLETKDIPLLLNYGGNAIFIIVLVFYKIFPKAVVND